MSKNKILVVAFQPSEVESCFEVLLRGKKPLPSPLPHIVAFPWTIDTKYYKAVTELWITHAVDYTESLASGLQDHVDAVILLTNPHSAQTWTRISSWSGFAEEFAPNIQLCVVMKSMSEGQVGVPTETYEKWCKQYSFELVSLDDVQDADTGRVAFPRVLEALQANVWDGLQTKNDSKPQTNESISESHGDLNPTTSAAVDNIFSSFLSSLEGVEEAAPAPTGKGSERDPFALGDDDVDEFEKALFQLKDLRRQAQGLPDGQRRALAAKVALSFLSNMGDGESGSDEASD